MNIRVHHGFYVNLRYAKQSLNFSFDILIFLKIHYNSTTILHVLALSEVQDPLSRILNEMMTDSWS